MTSFCSQRGGGVKKGQRIAVTLNVWPLQIAKATKLCFWMKYCQRAKRGMDVLVTTPLHLAYMVERAICFMVTRKSAASASKHFDWLTFFQHSSPHIYFGRCLYYRLVDASCAAAAPANFYRWYAIR